MYKLHLVDDSSLEVYRLNPSTFILSGGNDLYDQLSDSNLAIALLCDENDMLVDVFVDYTLQNFSCPGDGTIRFRLGPWDEVHRESNRERKRRLKFGRQVKEGVIKYEKY